MIRYPMILGAAPAGLVLAALAWFLFGGAKTVTGPLDQLEARLAALRPGAGAGYVSASDATSAAQAKPLFALTTGPGAVADIGVRLDGVVISPRGQSALISIDGKPADWLALGATRDGVTLMEVHGGAIRVDTALGFKDVALGQSVGGAATTPGGGGPFAANDAIPPGAHPPPQPPGAPVVRR